MKAVELLARETAEKIVKEAQALCNVNGIGMSMGCIRHLRAGDVGLAGSATINAIEKAIIDALKFEPKVRVKMGRRVI